MFCNKKKCVIHFHLWWWTCWTAAWNLFSNDMFYHTLCQSEVFTPHMHSDTPDTQLYKTLSQKNTSPGSPAGQPTVNVPPGSIGHNEVVIWVPRPAGLTSVWLTLQTDAGGRHSLLTWSVAAALTQVYWLLPVLSLSALVTSCHEWSVCKDKHPSYTISHF